MKSQADSLGCFMLACTSDYQVGLPPAVRILEWYTKMWTEEVCRVSSTFTLSHPHHTHTHHQAFPVIRDKLDFTRFHSDRYSRRRRSIGTSVASTPNNSQNRTTRLLEGSAKWTLDSRKKDSKPVMIIIMTAVMTRGHHQTHEEW